VHSAWKGHPRNDLYCVGWDVKLYSLTHLGTFLAVSRSQFQRSTFGHWAFAVGGLMAWNSLPDNLRDPSLCNSSFRCSL